MSQWMHAFQFWIASSALLTWSYIYIYKDRLKRSSNENATPVNSENSLKYYLNFFYWFYLFLLNHPPPQPYSFIIILNSTYPTQFLICILLTSHSIRRTLMITHRSWFVLIKVSGESGGVERTAARQESITTLKKKRNKLHGKPICLTKCKMGPRWELKITPRSPTCFSDTWNIKSKPGFTTHGNKDSL